MEPVVGIVLLLFVLGLTSAGPIDNPDKVIDELLSKTYTDTETLTSVTGLGMEYFWRRMSAELRVETRLNSFSRGDLVRLGNATASILGDSLIAITVPVGAGPLVAHFGNVEATVLRKTFNASVDVRSDDEFLMTVYWERDVLACTRCSASVVFGPIRYLTFDYLTTDHNIWGEVFLSTLKRLSHVSSFMAMVDERFFRPSLVKAFQEPVSKVAAQLLCKC